MRIPTVKIYECPDCNRKYLQDSAIYDDYEGAYVSTCCNEYMPIIDNLMPTTFCIALYDIDRAYGGPEEGGWYYDAGYIIPETTIVYSINELKEAEKYYNANKNARIFAYSNPDKHFPKHKPVYC